jgi:predicted MFS family arabinose efflux permease
MGTVALMALVLDLSGSSTAVAVILVLRLAPAALAGPLTARIIGRWNRRRTMLAMDAARVFIVAMIPLVRSLWWVYLWALLLETAGLAFLPARDAAVPDLAGEDDLPLANGLVLGSSYGTIPLGAGLFGLVSAVFGGHAAGSRVALVAVFFVDALTFAASFLMIWRITELSGRKGRSESGPSGRQPSFVGALRLPLVRIVAPHTLLAALGLGSLFSLGIVFVRQVLGASNTQFGFLVALFGVGAAIGLAVIQWRRLGGPRVMRLSLAVQGAVVAGMSLSPSTLFALGGAVAFGAATAATLTTAMSMLQTQLENEERVMAFSVFHVSIRAGLAVAAVAAGVAADLIGGVRWPGVGHLPPTRTILLLSGLLVLISAAATRLPQRPSADTAGRR